MVTHNTHDEFSTTMMEKTHTERKKKLKWKRAISPPVPALWEMAEAAEGRFFFLKFVSEKAQQ